MPSNSYRQWRTTRTAALDEIAEAHAAVGGTARGRRHATQQINRAYAILLAAEFQGYCRDLHTECVYHLLRVLAPPSTIRSLLRAELVRGRQLDRGNAQPSSLGADFGRLDIDLWTALREKDANSIRWRADLELLNEWRNAIAHQDFTSSRLGGIIILRLERVRRWRASCHRLARAIDEVMHQHLLEATKAPPW
jgi:hypothetical protein